MKPGALIGPKAKKMAARIRAAARQAPRFPHRARMNLSERTMSTITRSETTALYPARPGVSPLTMLASRISTGIRR